jgi:hypothetical protein
MAKEGRKTKDREITEGFNQKKIGGESQKELNKIKAASARAAKKKKAEEAKARREKTEEKKREMEALGNDVNAAAGALPAERPGGKGEEEPDADAKAAYQMLQDMRWVYRKVKGRTKLKNLIEDDDKQFVVMVKELMKIEASLMAAKVRAKEYGGGISQQTVFVILKGLDAIPIDVSDKDVDMKQVSRAISPDGEELT